MNDLKLSKLENPFGTPKHWEQGIKNREDLTRSNLLDLLNRRLEDRISPNEFLDILEIFESSEDNSVVFAANCLESCDALWIENIDQITKQEWDYVQRFILFLKTDCILKPNPFQKKWMYSKKNLIFLILLIAYLVFFYCFSFTLPTYLFSVAIWTGIYATYFFVDDTEPYELPFLKLTYPFLRIKDLELAIKQTGFRKQIWPFRKPTKATRRRLLMTVGGFILNTVSLIIANLVFAIFIPFFLFFAAFPEKPITIATVEPSRGPIVMGR